MNTFNPARGFPEYKAEVQRYETPEDKVLRSIIRILLGLNIPSSMYFFILDDLLQAIIDRNNIKIKETLKRLGIAEDQLTKVCDSFFEEPNITNYLKDFQASTPK